MQTLLHSNSTTPNHLRPHNKAMLSQKSFRLATKFLFISLLLYSVASSHELVCDPHDKSTLLAFSQNLSTSSPLNCQNLSTPSPLNWSSSTNCCQWEGVVCDTNGRVISLHLYSRGLKGVISDTIGNLVSLTHLNLSNNYLYGPLGDEGITKLINLRTIDFSANSISGPIPPKIGNLLHLERLHLQYNNLSGPIPPSLMRCTKLIDIFLSDNHLEGDISKLDLSKLARLQKLDLMNNTFSGTLPESLYSCKSLTAIRVAANKLTGQISPKILELKSLSFLSLGQNSFTNITRALTILANCNNLTALFLGPNFVGEYLPSNTNFLGANGFPQLQYFSLDSCSLIGSFPEWLSNMKTLRGLTLRKNQITGRIPDWMGTLPNLFFIELSSNHLYGEIPQKLCQLPALIPTRVDPKLNQFHLELPFFSLERRAFQQVTTFPSSLIFYNNTLSGRIPSEIGKLQGLQRIHFANNYLSGNIPASICTLTNLEMLLLSANNLTGEIPTSLKNLHFLSHLDLSYNDLEGPVPTGGQLDTFEQEVFQGNPRLCGELVHHSCSNTPKPEADQPLESGHHKRRSFLPGLYVGFASGFTGTLIIVASYVWFNTRIK